MFHKTVLLTMHQNVERMYWAVLSQHKPSKKTDGPSLGVTHWKRPQTAKWKLPPSSKWKLTIRELLTRSN